MNEQEDIHRRIDILDAILNDFEEATQASANAKVDYDLAYSSAVLRANGKVAEQEAQAIIACQTEYRNKVAAEAEEAFLKTKIRALEAQISALQSILSAESRVHFGTASHRT